MATAGSRRPGSSPATFQSTPEYDAFGPWVLPVTTAEEIPPLFRAAGVDLGAAHVVVKVPRPISRRDATPSMDLYDHLLVVDHQGLTVLTRADRAFRTRTVAADQLLGIQDSVDLLDGRLTVFPTGPQGPVTVTYSGASQDVVGRLVAALRALYRPHLATGAPAELQTRPAVGLGALAEDQALVGMYHEVARDEPDLRVLAAHPRQVLVPKGEGAQAALSRALHLAWPATLHAALVCADGPELQILHRRRWLTRGSAPTHSVARTILPFARVGAVRVADHDRYHGVRVVTVELGSARLDLPVPAGSGAEQVLTAALGAR